MYRDTGCAKKHQDCAQRHGVCTGAQSVHRGTECAQGHGVCTGAQSVHRGMGCVQRHGLCKQAPRSCTEAQVVHRSTRLCLETQGFVHRGMKGVCVMMPEEQRGPEFQQLQ